MKYLPALLLSAACLAAEGESAWDFQDAVRGWIEPAGAGAVIPEPGSPENRVYRIVATQPHHTQLVLAGSEATPDFVASLRFRLLASEGAAPGVYVYGRLSEGRFRGLTVQENSARAFCWFGTDQPAVTIGSVESPAALSSGAWLQAKVACVGDHMFAKIWRYGGREPGWQIVGQCPGQPAGRFALGVWTSPRQASTAEVLFDDVSFRPLTPADLPSIGIRLEPRPGLPMGDLPAGPGTFETAGLIGICTERTVLAFERDSGAIAHVIDRRTGQEFISPTVFRPLFRLGLSRSSGRETLPVSADELAAAWTAAGGALRGRFAGAVGEAGFPLAVEVEVTADPEGMLRFRARVRQDADWAVARVDLPLMAHPAALGDSAD